MGRIRCSMGRSRLRAVAVTVFKSFRIISSTPDIDWDKWELNCYSAVEGKGHYFLASELFILFQSQFFVQSVLILDPNKNLFLPLGSNFYFKSDAPFSDGTPQWKPSTIKLKINYRNIISSFSLRKQHSPTIQHNIYSYIFLSTFFTLAFKAILTFVREELQSLCFDRILPFQHKKPRIVFWLSGM